MSDFVYSLAKRIVTDVRSNSLVKNYITRQQQQHYDKIFAEDCYGCFRGVYDTVEEALRSAPPTKQVGYNHDELASEYAAQLQQSVKVRSYDYPVMFWLEKILPDCTKLLDFGGNVGIHYYSYRQYLKFPESLEWRIQDVPAIVKAGEALAQQLPPLSPVFSTNADGYSPEIFLASGSLQYFGEPTKVIPISARHVLMNRMPIYPGPSYVTLQNGGSVFYACHVFNEKDLFDSMESSGYELVDLWVDHIDSGYIPFHPDKCIDKYHGMYWRKGG